MCKVKLSVGAAEDAYDVFLAIAISVIYVVVTNLIASIPYAELKSHKKDWYSDGPPLSLLPLLTPDPARPYDNTCQECKGFCMDHYLKSDHLEELAKNSDVVSSNKPPSQVIADAFKEHKGITFRG